MMTRKTSAVLGVGALLLALLVGQVGSGQMPMGPMGPSPQVQMDPQRLEQEIELLIAINRMGLSPEQLKQLQQILSGLQAPQPMHRQHREELRRFLLGWQGTPEAFEQALQSFQQERRQQLEQLKAQNRERIDQLKDVLTYRQGELLHQALRRLSRPPMGNMGMSMGMGPQGGPAHGTAPGPQPGMGMGPMGPMGRMGPGQAQPGMGGTMPMMQMMQQHMQIMYQMMQRMGQMGRGGMGMGMGMMGMGRMGQGPAQAPTLEELIEQHLELLQRVIAQKLQALQGR